MCLAVVLARVHPFLVALCFYRCLPGLLSCRCGAHPGVTHLAHTVLVGVCAHTWVEVTALWPWGAPDSSVGAVLVPGVSTKNPTLVSCSKGKGCLPLNHPWAPLN